MPKITEILTKLDEDPCRPQNVSESVFNSTIFFNLKMMQPTEPEILKGFLLKRGTGILRGWKKRFFVFEKGVMKYYGTYPYEEKDLKKIVYLQDYCVVMKPENVIYLSSSTKDARDFFLIADERNISSNDWYEAIKEHIEFSKDSWRNSVMGDDT